MGVKSEVINNELRVAAVLEIENQFSAIQTKCFSDDLMSENNQTQCHKTLSKLQAQVAALKNT